MIVTREKTREALKKICDIIDEHNEEFLNLRDKSLIRTNIVIAILYLKVDDFERIQYSEILNKLIDLQRLITNLTSYCIKQETSSKILDLLQILDESIVELSLML